YETVRFTHPHHNGTPGSDRARGRGAGREERRVLVDREGLPAAAGPGVVNDRDVAVVKGDLQKAWRAQAGRVAEQRGAGVQTELAGHVRGGERPGGVDVSTAKEMAADPGEPGGELARVLHPLGPKLRDIGWGRGERVVAGHDQPTGTRGRIGHERPGAFEL